MYIKKFFSIFVLFFLIFPSVIFAGDSFPSDSLSLRKENNTASDNFNQLWLSNSDNHTRTLLYFSSQNRSSTSARVKIYCGNGGEVMYDDMITAQYSFDRFSRYKCDKAIYIDSPRYTFVTAIYVDYDITIGGSGEPTLINDFTGGDLIISTFLLILIFLKLLEFIKNAFVRVPLLKDFQVNTSDGKERHKI